MSVCFWLPQTACVTLSVLSESGVGLIFPDEVLTFICRCLKTSWSVPPPVSKDASSVKSCNALQNKGLSVFGGTCV